jgi:hypothetical protein
MRLIGRRCRGHVFKMLRCSKRHVSHPHLPCSCQPFHATLSSVHHLCSVETSLQFFLDSVHAKGSAQSVEHRAVFTAFDSHRLLFACGRLSITSSSRRKGSTPNVMASSRDPQQNSREHEEIVVRLAQSHAVKPVAYTPT